MTKIKLKEPITWVKYTGMKVPEDTIWDARIAGIHVARLSHRIGHQEYRLGAPLSISFEAKTWDQAKQYAEELLLEWANEIFAPNTSINYF